MIIRTAKEEDIAAFTQIGKECYPAEETITQSDYKKRLNAYPEHFLVLEERGEVAAFISGPVINVPRIEDDMFHNIEWHDEDGDWQSILGLNTSPKFQKMGFASQILKQFISAARKQERKGCVLSCKKTLIDYYKKFGFEVVGVSNSTLAGHKWYDMILTFSDN